MKCFSSVSLFLLFAFTTEATFSQRTYPRLLADQTDLAKAKQWMRDHGWYRNIVEAHKREIDRFIAKRPIYVSSIKQVYEYKMYTCPKHDVELLYEDTRPFEHRCRVDTTEVYNGGKYDMAWAGWYNRLLASRLVWMGILHHLYEDERYADAGREILMRFADLYLKYPTTNTILGPAHVFFGTLSESFWGTDMAYGYDLLYTYKGFTEADRRKLKDDLFYPLARITQQFPESASNRQLWYNNVSAAVGFLFGDQELIDFALKGEYGFYWQLGSATPESGFWAEWSGYHYVALRGMIHLAEMARHNGIDLYHVTIAGRSMKKMFDVPFEIILPNYEFPRLKDSGGGNILEYAPYYEVAYAVYKDPKYVALLNRTSLLRGKQVVGETSALGEADAPVTMFMIEPVLPFVTLEFIPDQSVNLEGNGFAILRNGSGKDRRYLYLDYGIMGGEHGHPDRLQIGYYANGRNWIVDPLNESYFNPNLQQWFRQSIAHVTPVVDQTSQSWTNGEGVFFGALPSMQVASGRSSRTYPGSLTTRTLIQVGSYFLDLVDFESPDIRIVDWPLQSFGRLEVAGVAFETEPRDLFGHQPGIPGYDQLVDIQSATTAMPWIGVFSENNQHLTVMAIGEPGTQLFRATAPRIGGFYKQMVTNPQPMPMLLSRRQTKSTRFAHLLHAYDGKSEIAQFEKGSTPNTYRVRTAKGEDILYVDVPKAEYSFVRSENGRVTMAAGFGVKEIRLGNEIILESDMRLTKFEAQWSDGKVFVQLPDHYHHVGIAPKGAHILVVRGEEWPVASQTGLVLIRNTKTMAMELLEPGDSTLFVGKTNQLQLLVWNPTSNPLHARAEVRLSPDWKERMESQLTWWGGVVNLLPLNKGSVRRTISPKEPSRDVTWIDGRSSDVVTVPPFGSAVIRIPLEVPNDAALVTHLATVRFGSATLHKRFRVAQPVTADVHLPNRRGEIVEIMLTNNTPSSQTITAQLSLGKEWKVIGSARNTLTLQAKEEKKIAIPAQFVGYNPQNQYSPARLHIEQETFSTALERDLYVGIAHYARQTPSLDGSWQGWERAHPIVINLPSQVHKLLLGNQPWLGPTDLSANIYAMYDEKHLYVGAEVTDQTVISRWDYPRMSYAWDTDCMEVVIDTRTTADQGTDPPTPGLFRHLSMPEYRKTELPVELWRGHGAGGPTLPKPLLVQNAETYFKKRTNGYSIICRYPFASLNGLVPQPGAKIGFDVAINDNDGSTYRKNTHIWAGYTANQTWWDMGSIGALIFGPK